MECDSAIRKVEVPPFATMRTDLETIVLSEIRLKTTCYHSYVGSKTERILKNLLTTQMCLTLS